MICNWLKNEKTLCFLGGAVAAFASMKLARSEKTRTICVKGLAKGMKLQQDAKVTLQNMKEEAQDICYDAKQKANGAESCDEA